VAFFEGGSKMKRKKFISLIISLASLFAFLLWTVLARLIDVKGIGPENSEVGFASFNSFLHNLTGVNMTLYEITDWLGILVIGIAVGFGVLGFVQLIKRKSIKRVDYSILVLGGFYITVIAFYLFFELVTINYRPLLIEGRLEASYPSSTTVLSLCVLITGIIELNNRLKKRAIKLLVSVAFSSLATFMVVGRILSGVHWASDIIGGIFLSLGLIMMYYFILNSKINRE
jgi:undecaprenyl-diphosphatase